MRRAAILILLLLPACEQIDPYAREGVWRPLGANEANLRLHVATPSHLDRGVNEPRADGHVQAAAVQRYRTDRVKVLPASGVSRIQATGQKNGATPAGGGDGGR